MQYGKDKSYLSQKNEIFIIYQKEFLDVHKASPNIPSCFKYHSFKFTDAISRQQNGWNSYMTRKICFTNHIWNLN
jgi:hypothetical protein